MMPIPHCTHWPKNNLTWNAQRFNRDILEDYNYEIKPYRIPKTLKGYRMEWLDENYERFTSRSWKDSYRCRHNWQKHDPTKPHCNDRITKKEFIESLNEFNNY